MTATGVVVLLVLVAVLVGAATRIGWWLGAREERRSRR